MSYRVNVVIYPTEDGTYGTIEIGGRPIFQTSKKDVLTKDDVLSEFALIMLELTEERR